MIQEKLNAKSLLKMCQASRHTLAACNCKILSVRIDKCHIKLFFTSSIKFCFIFTAVCKTVLRRNMNLCLKLCVFLPSCGHLE